MTKPRILADSSIWIDHINRQSPDLTPLLRSRRIVLHPMIIGEIALGSIRERAAFLAELAILPKATVASHAEVLAIIEWAKLYNRGIGFIDAHLLSSARLTPNCLIWTRDKSLQTEAARLDIAFAP